MDDPKTLRPSLTSKKYPRRFTARFGPVAVIFALFIGLVSFLIFSGFTPIAPTNGVVLGLRPERRLDAPRHLGRRGGRRGR